MAANNAVDAGVTLVAASGNDGDADLNDDPAFLDCMARPAGGLSAGCGEFDFDGDSDVDAGDFAVLQQVFTGP